MCYFNGRLHGSMNLETGAYVAPPPVTRVYCDGCAEAAIPLPETGPHGDAFGRHFDTGFSWAPRYGGPCDECGRAC